MASKSVSEVMAPVTIFVEPGESVKKAAYLMLRNNVVLLPVLENKRKLVGIVRMVEIFEEISNAMVENNKTVNTAFSEEGAA